MESAAKASQLVL